MELSLLLAVCLVVAGAANQARSCTHNKDCAIFGAGYSCISGNCTVRTCGHATPVSTRFPGEYSYRLVGGDSCENGWVQASRDGFSRNDSVAYRGTNFFCDNQWDAHDATVVCRSLGFTTGRPGAAVQGSRPPKDRIWANQGYNCEGRETSLWDCQRIGMGERESCTLSEYVTVTCSNQCTDSVCTCPGFWNRNNTECRPGVAPGQPCTYDEDCSTYRAGYACISDTCTLPPCTYNKDCAILGAGYSCISGNCTVRTCGHFTPVSTRFPGRYSYRLVGGDSCENGWVQASRDGFSRNDSVAYRGTNYVCDNQWDAHDATVVCRSLGFKTGRPGAAVQGSRPPGDRIWAHQGYNCEGRETSLWDCQRIGINERAGKGKPCTPSEYVTVTCGKD